MCTGGNHRSPTVANELSCRGRYTVHATLGGSYVPAAHVAALVHACVRGENTAEFYMDFIVASRNSATRFQLCIGWTSINLDTRRPNEDALCVEHGTEVQVLETDAHMCIVEAEGTGHTYILPVTWLLPKSVCGMFRSI